jgi:UDPglucose 6-dehydrogenase
MTRPVIGYAGMTHLGLVSASAAAGQGFRTVAFDPDAALIGRLKSGDFPVSEPGLPELIDRHKPALVFSADVAALAECDVVYVAVDVPTDDQGQSNLTPIRAMVERVRPRLGAKAVLVILSQVPPGIQPGVVDARRAALLSGGDSRVRTRRGARHQAGEIHRWLRRSAASTASGV